MVLLQDLSALRSSALQAERHAMARPAQQLGGELPGWAAGGLEFGVGSCWRGLCDARREEVGVDRGLIFSPGDAAAAAYARPSAAMPRARLHPAWSRESAGACPGPGTPRSAPLHPQLITASPGAPRTHRPPALPPRTTCLLLLPRHQPRGPSLLAQPAPPGAARSQGARRPQHAAPGVSPGAASSEAAAAADIDAAARRPARPPRRVQHIADKQTLPQEPLSSQRVSCRVVRGGAASPPHHHHPDAGLPVPQRGFDGRPPSAHGAHKRLQPPDAPVSLQLAR
jgi:hypothetical protein